MKKIFTLILATLFLTSMTVYAQKEITVNAASKEMSRGMQPGFVVNVPEAKMIDVREAYEKILEENTKAKAKEINTELVSYGVVNKSISPNPFIVYAKIIETIEGVELTAFVTEDSLNFINESSTSDKANAIKISLRDFSVAEYKKVAARQLDAEKAKLAEMKKTLDKQVSEESSNTKEISQKEREIDSYKKKIADSKVQQASKSEQISKQNKMIDDFSDKKSPEYELAKKNLKKYEGEKKDMIKDEEKLSRNIDENNAEIKELQNENEELKKQQESSKQSIANQEAVVRASETKLNGIR